MPGRVYERARLQFSDEEIAEAFAATRGLTMPSQLRRMIREQGRDLHAEFIRLLPERHRRRSGSSAGRSGGSGCCWSASSARRAGLTARRCAAAEPAVRRPALLLSWLLLAALAAGCVNSGALAEDVGRLPTAPAQPGTVRRGVLVMAQAVPSAQWLPCIRTVPAGLDVRRAPAAGRRS